MAKQRHKMLSVIFSHEIRKPYEEQRYLEGAVDRHADELIAQIQFWLHTNLS